MVSSFGIMVPIVYNFRISGGNFTRLPEYFRKHGYRTARTGKIFHVEDDAASFDEVVSGGKWPERPVSHLAVNQTDIQNNPLPDQVCTQNSFDVIVWGVTSFHGSFEEP